MPESIRDPHPTAQVFPLPWDRPGILVGIDGSGSSVRAFRQAADMAPRLGLPLHALVVWDYATFLYDTTFSPELQSMPQDDARRVSDATAAEVFPNGVPEWFTRSTQRGRPAFTLIERSVEAAMLVVGSRGHGGFTGLLLGSVSFACVSHTHCPVLVVPDPPTHDHTATQHHD